MSQPSRVYGYHGTNQIAANTILQTGFNLSDNDYDWLGTGVYFFQDAPIRALEWAKQQYPDHPAVICSLIRLENCMDLLDVEWTSTIISAYNTYIAQCQSANLVLPRQTKGAHRLDCAVINYTVNYLEEQAKISINVVRAAFLEGLPLFPGSYLYDRTHVQIAVRNMAMIESSSILLTQG